MFRIRTLTMALAASILVAPPAMAGTLSLIEACEKCWAAFTECQAKADGDIVKLAKCQADLDKCQGKKV